jgi:23S rRNA (adenine2503-C2)-methyltransferase
MSQLNPEGSHLPALVGLTTSEISSLLQTNEGLPAFRGKQIAEWLYRRIMPEQNGGYKADFQQMTDLPAALRESLAQSYTLFPITQDLTRKDPTDGTVKALARLNRGQHAIECVLLPDTSRVSSCLSTQAGCPMACAFCATGTQGLTRNLDTGEIVAQFLLLQSLSERRISHIVLMGMGEPLLNYEATLKAIRIINEEIGVSMRHITLSTVGIVPKIDELAKENLQLTLAVSLHAPTDELRRSIVPVAKTYPLDRLMESCRNYARETHRRLTFEYVLLKEVNDRPEDAHQLGALIKGMPAALNIIPYNATSVTEQFQRPEPARISAFKTIVERYGVTVTQRKERGRQIAAACGQLVTETEHSRPGRQALPMAESVAL